jgi:hypothetical protein
MQSTLLPPNHVSNATNICTSVVRSQVSSFIENQGDIIAWGGSGNIKNNDGPKTNEERFGTSLLSEFWSKDNYKAAV